MCTEVSLERRWPSNLLTKRSKLNTCKSTSLKIMERSNTPGPDHSQIHKIHMASTSPSTNQHGPEAFMWKDQTIRNWVKLRITHLLEWSSSNSTEAGLKIMINSTWRPPMTSPKLLISSEVWKRSTYNFRTTRLPKPRLKSLKKNGKWPGRQRYSSVRSPLSSWAPWPMRWSMRTGFAPARKKDTWKLCQRMTMTMSRNRK